MGENCGSRVKMGVCRLICTRILCSSPPSGHGEAAGHYAPTGLGGDSSINFAIRIKLQAVATISPLRPVRWQPL